MPHVTHALSVASSAPSFSIALQTLFRPWAWTLFQPWTLFWLWTLFWPWTPWHTHFGSTLCDTHYVWWALLPFFYCTVNAFLTVNYMMHALWLCLVWCMHYVWQAPLSLFYCTVNSFLMVNSFLTMNSVTHTIQLLLNFVWWAPLALFLLYHELFFDCELHEKHTLALPPVMHALHVASFACFFCIVPWTLFWPWTFFRPWTLWRMHFGSTPCDACTTCGELCCLFFFISLNSFPTGNSYLMVNSLRQALWLCPVWRTH